MGKKDNIASELAKKAIRFVDDDKKDEKRLSQLLAKTDEYLAEVDDRSNQIIGVIKDNNPGIRIDNDTIDDILVFMEKKVSSGEITSIENVNSPEIVKTVESNIISKVNYEKSVSDMLETSLKTGAIVFGAEITKAILSGTLAFEQLNNLENVLDNSLEIKEKTAHSIDNIINGNSSEKDNQFMVARMNKPNQYFVEHRDDKAMRGSIIMVARLAAMGGEYAMNKARLRGAEYGVTELFDENGNFDMHKAYEALREKMKDDPQLLKRYPTEEIFIEELKNMNERNITRNKKEFSKISPEFKKELDSLSPKEKVDSEINMIDYISRRPTIVSEYTRALIENDLEKIQELDKEIPSYDKDSINKIRNKVKVKDITKSETEYPLEVDR